MTITEVNARPPAAGPRARTATAPSASASTSSGGRLASITRTRPGAAVGDLLVGRGDPLEEALVFALEPVGVLAAALLARSSEPRVHPQQQREVGLEAPGGEGVDLRHLLDPEAAGAPLVGQGGVHEAVQQHDHAPLEQRPEQLLHELGAGSRVQQRLRPRKDLKARVLDQLPDPLGGLHATRLAQQLHLGTTGGELAGEGLGERRLAGPVEPLDRDQSSRHDRPPYTGRAGRFAPS